MKKGIQYSHYCGSELLEIISAIDLCIDYSQENPKEAKKWADYAKDQVNKLRIKISDLDILNEMNY